MIVGETRGAVFSLCFVEAQATLGRFARLFSTVSREGDPMSVDDKTKSSTRLLLIAGAIATILGIVLYLALAPSGDGGRIGENGQEQEGYSIFDMLDTGDQSDQEELTPEFAAMLETTNPRTGLPYTESEAKKVQFLSKKFPDNDLVPRPLTPEQVQERENRLKQYEQQGFRITSGEAQPEEIEEYYAFKAGFYTDKIELLKFALAAEDVEEETYARIEKMLDAANRVVERLARRKNDSLELYEKRQAGDFEGEAQQQPDEGEGAAGSQEYAEINAASRSPAN
jgi:hypothetical protein